ncbi:histone deacetylase [Stieleria sp. TO1_6]|uniref:histone deacetylase family protein n=1 Tax=Stieleria tagensis TaxID=2956795 RepID=UPI00209B6405|nr:histone deacetylase [Stieleria tagensis]MCO8122667.1 histone deacetylase [Stieleria tagensis]
MKFVYSRQYDIGLGGIERLHPFDTKKYSRAWRLIESQFGSALTDWTITVDRPIEDGELLSVHDETYLRHLRVSRYVAGALEIPMLRWLPGRVIDHFALRPMRWATRGTVLAAQAAHADGLAANLAGGYHHAKPQSGEGFCIYNDIAIALKHLWLTQRIGSNARVCYIDLDAHIGNGVAAAFRKDPRVKLFDMYNGEIYPCHDRGAKERIDRDLPLQSGTGGEQYLNLLHDELPSFLDSDVFSFAVYNAGTDVYQGDQLGGLGLTIEQVRDRDEFVLTELTQRGIPALFLPSGGYSDESHRMIATSLIDAANRHRSGE